MKITLRGDYALRALIYLSDHYGEGIVRIQEISEQQNIPKRFLEQILNDVKSGGFVESRRGIAGGYQLARPPGEITLADLIRYLEGTLLAMPGDTEPRSKKKAEKPDEVQMAIRSVMKDVQDLITGALKEITLADLCERARAYRVRPDVLDYTI